MKTTDSFTYTSKYNKYPNCFFGCNRYGMNGNLALEIYSEEEGLITTCSVNTERKLDDNSIGIKDYSENEGMVKFLSDIGIIEKEPFDGVNSGFVFIGFYKLTDSGKELFGNLLTNNR